MSVFGTLLQIGISVGVVALLGKYLDWSISKIVFLGFVISLSSTAVVLKLLEDWKELDTRVGQDVLGVLLVQDLLIVPMVIVLEVLGGDTVNMGTLATQIAGGIVMLLLAGWLIYVDKIQIPWIHHLERDHEMQLFIALGICFGMAMITGFLGLSAPFGAFIGGMIVSTARQTDWVHRSLSSFRTIFMAMFFVSVGMMIDIAFLSEYFQLVTILVVAAILTNTLINAAILRVLGTPWRASLYAASLLSQIGEFSFVLAALGVQVGIINQIGYQMTISVISVTLLICPMWIGLVRYLTNIAEGELKPL